MNKLTMSATNANDALERGLLAISLPLFLEILLTYLINFTDVLFLNYVSEASAAAVGTLMPVIVIPIVILHSLSIGTTAVLGRMLGAGETEGLPRNYRHTVVFNTGVGVAVMLV
ncbi:MATE family efflux transporter, partial [Photobacterium sanctipauli]